MIFRRRYLPWEYATRNLWRRPFRTWLTILALAIVVAVVLVLLGFVRGLERSLAHSGDDLVVLVYSIGAEESYENSSIPASIGQLLAANVPAIQRRGETAYVSPELYGGTRIEAGGRAPTSFGLVRGVTMTAPLVRRHVRIVEGRWPESGEVMVGRLAAAKMGYTDNDLVIGSEIEMEGRTWRISGWFAAAGSVLEAEVWCPLADLQEAMQRQDLTLVATRVSQASGTAEVDMFCKSRIDLELQSYNEAAYFKELNQFYAPIRVLAWMVTLLVAAAGAFAALNVMYGAVAGRVREMATLQALGWRRRAILVSLVQEGILMSAAAALIAGGFAFVLLDDVAVRVSMGAFALRVDGISLLIGCGMGVALGVIGTIPPAVKALRLSVVESLKAI